MNLCYSIVTIASIIAILIFLKWGDPDPEGVVTE